MRGVNRTAAIAAGAGFLVGGVLVALFMFFATPRLVAAQPQPSPSATASPNPSASPKKQATPAQKAVATAVGQALADALGMSPADLRKALHGGTTVQQLASQKGIAQATLQASFSEHLKAHLDQAVSTGTITSDQESKVLARYQSKIPHWDKPLGQH
jgi:hypothetical protein